MMYKTIIKSIAVLLTFMAFSAQAHLIYFAYQDNGDGTIDLYGQHYHHMSNPAGVGIEFTDVNDNNNVVLAQWNDTIANASVNDLMALFELEWDLSDSSSHSDSRVYNWLVIRDFSIANGTYSLASKSPSAVDWIWPGSSLPQLTVNLTNVSEPHAALLFLLAGFGLATRVRKST